MSPAARRRTLVSAALFLLPVLMLAGAWRLGGVSALEDDLIYYLPIREYIGECIRAGEWPLWNPYVAMGTSIAADPQSGLWYPPSLLFVVLPSLVAYPVSLVLHFALAGGGMYRFLRASRHDWQAALLGALAFEFCGYVVAHRAHLTIHHAAAWLPWMLYGWRRFAQSGRLAHAAIASGAFGLQMLVQHVQVSIISAALVTAFVGFVLLAPGSGGSRGRQGRRALWWAYPAGMAAGAMISGVQLVPTWLHYAGSVRGAPNYYLFNENAWLPGSALLMLFPMLLGARTPNALWSEPWSGESHFCEQSAYGSILVLLLALVSFRLAKSPVVPEQAAGRSLPWARRMGLLARYAPSVWKTARTRGILSGPPEAMLMRDRRARSRFLPAARSELDSLKRRLTTGWRGEQAFWWAACAVALLIALGDRTPLGRLLFQVPLYRSLRVPARWILVWSTAMPVLASSVVTAVQRGSAEASRLQETARYVVGRILPLTVAVFLMLPVLPSDPALSFVHRLPISRLHQPAVWWPILMMLVTSWVLLWWIRGRQRTGFGLMCAVYLVDTWAIAGSVDVDTRVYSRAELTHPPPLARALHELSSGPGERLLVPRSAADYGRPIEVLWPQYNLRHRVPTSHGYGPLWPIGSRLLFRFMPWGSSEEMLALLRNEELLKAAGVRFIAVRSSEERGLLAAAAMPDLAEPQRRPVPGSEQMTAVVYRRDRVWGPIEISEPGLYELAMDAEPAPNSGSRWFVRLETPEKEEIGETRTIEPADMSAGGRRIRFLFRLDRPVPALMIRVKSEIGQALSAGRATLGRVAALPDREEVPPTSRFVHRAELPGGISLYETADYRPLMYFADETEPVEGLAAAIERMSRPTRRAVRQGVRGVVVELAEMSPEAAGRKTGSIRLERRSGSEVLADVESGGGLLVFNESYDPGWRGRIDGQAAPLLRVNALCQGMIVPPGPHQVRFLYSPPGLVPGAVLSLAGVVLLVTAALRRGACR